MVGSGQGHRGQKIEGQFSVGFGIFDLLRFGRRFQSFVVRVSVFEGPRFFALEGENKKKVNSIVEGFLNPLNCI